MPRFLSLIRLDENEELPADPDLDPEYGQRMGALFEEITKAGVMLDTAALVPTAQGARVHRADGTISVTDGPFTESKEVIGGYAVLQARDMAEAVEWTRRFLQAHQPRAVLSAEVRQIQEG